MKYNGFIMPKWMITFYWVCVAFLILMCAWLVFDYDNIVQPKQKFDNTMKIQSVSNAE